MRGFPSDSRGRAPRASSETPLSPCVWLDENPIGKDAFVHAANQTRLQSVYPFLRDFIEQVREAKDFSFDLSLILCGGGGQQGGQQIGFCSRMIASNHVSICVRCSAFPVYPHNILTLSI